MLNAFPNEPLHHCQHHSACLMANIVMHYSVQVRNNKKWKSVCVCVRTEGGGRVGVGGQDTLSGPANPEHELNMSRGMVVVEAGDGGGSLPGLFRKV